MRIAIFCEYYYPYISGVVTHIETLSNGLRAEGHTVLIVTLDPAAQRPYLKGNVLYCPAKGLKKVYGYGVTNPFDHLRFRFVELFRPDLIHIQTEFTCGMFGLYCAKRLNLPVVYTLHTMYDDYLFYVMPKKLVEPFKPIAHRFFRTIAGRAAQVIGPSRKVENYLRLCGFKKQVNVIPNTVDTSAFFPENVAKKDVEAASGVLGLKAGDVPVCFVSRIGREKSIDLLIDWFWQCFGGEERFKLFIIGDGPEKPALDAQVERLGAGGQVRMMGRIDHAALPPYYQACTLFATASVTEMNSISLIEANASGLYTAHRLDADNLDQIEDGVNGRFFETRDEFEQIIREHAALTKAQREKRKQGVVDYARRYGPKEFTEAVMVVYDKAISEGRH